MLSEQPTSIEYPLPTPEDLALTAPMSIGETRQVGRWLLHRYSVSLRATDITNAGKRGKKCPTLTLWARRDLSESAVGLVLWNAKQDLSLAEIEEDLRLESLNATQAGREGWLIEIGEQRGIDVELPADTIEINTDHFHAKFTQNGFTVADKYDLNNLPTLMSLDGHGRREIRRVYDWAKANRARLADMTFAQVHHELCEGRFQYHHYCAMD